MLHTICLTKLRNVFPPSARNTKSSVAITKMTPTKTYSLHASWQFLLNPTSLCCISKPTFHAWPCPTSYRCAKSIEAPLSRCILQIHNCPTPVENFVNRLSHKSSAREHLTNRESRLPAGNSAKRIYPLSAEICTRGVDVSAPCKPALHRDCTDATIFNLRCNGRAKKRRESESARVI